MLLDDKTQTEDSEHYKVFDFIKNYTESGGLDLVTVFFSVNALALMKDDINQAEKFRLILGNLIPEQRVGQDDNNLKTIEKVYKELSDPKHPVSIAMSKLQDIEEVNIIEGRK